uniref:Homeobox_KN domain-containing protein n=1 Tax=Globodera pallida TaxID=36090 RepID=A0A183CLL8_GLOPA
MVVVPVYNSATVADDDDKEARTTKAELVITSAVTAGASATTTTTNNDCSIGETAGETSTRKTAGTVGASVYQHHRNNTIKSLDRTSERMVSELLAVVIEQSRQRRLQQQLLDDDNDEFKQEQNVMVTDDYQHHHLNNDEGGGCSATENVPNSMENGVPVVVVDEAQQKDLFLRWVQQHGNNMYPSREQKERLAAQLCTNYEKVNKLFANYRRRQHKHQKVVKKTSSTASSSFCSLPVSMEVPRRNDADGEEPELNPEPQATNSWDERERKIDETIEDIRNRVIGGAGTDRHAEDTIACRAIGTTRSSPATTSCLGASSTHSQEHRPEHRPPSLHAAGHKRKALFTDGWSDDDASCFISSRGGRGRETE